MPPDGARVTVIALSTAAVAAAAATLARAAVGPGRSAAPRPGAHTEALATLALRTPSGADPRLAAADDDAVAHTQSTPTALVEPQACAGCGVTFPLAAFTKRQLGKAPDGAASCPFRHQAAQRGLPKPRRQPRGSTPRQ